MTDTLNPTSTGATVKVTASIARFIWRDKSGANDWCIVQIDGGGAGNRLPCSTAKGRIVGAAVGRTFDFEGEVVTDKFGPAIVVSRAVQVVPTTKDAIRRFLVELPSIGSVSAMNLVRKFGERTLDVLRTGTLEELREDGIRGLTEQKLAEIRMAIEAETSTMDLELRVRSMLGAVGSEVVLRRVLDAWGHEAPARIQRNPWSLAKIHGIGFLKADSVAENLGVSPTAPERIAAGLRYTCDDLRGSGSTRILRYTLVDDTQKLLAFDRAGDGFTLVETELLAAIERGDYVQDDNPAGGLMLAADWRAERDVAEMLRKRLANRGEKIKPFKLTSADLFPDQQAALQAMLDAGRSGTFVLTGAPGTGKTTMVRQFLPHFRIGRMVLCAPTGKAARRLSQQAGMQAATIHSTLEPRPREVKAGDAAANGTAADGKKGAGLVFGFTRDESNPLDADLVVIDESSMVDVYLMRDVLRAVPPSAYLLIVGDPNQLASVGVGAVLRDLIRSGVVPCAELTEIKRTNPGLLLTHIHQVKEGRWEPVRNTPTQDLLVMRTQTEDEAVATIVEIYLDRLPKSPVLNAAPPAGSAPFDPVQDVQILIPWKDKQPLGTKAVNLAIQQRRALAGAVKLLGKWSYGIGDKVIQTRNDYQLGIVNGDIGVVKDMRDHEDAEGRRRLCYEVDFAGYAQTVMVPAAGNDLELAYAVTIHKAQGSEWPVVVMAAVGCESHFYDRHLFYTGLSRAQRMAVVVGKQEDVGKVLSRVTAENRRTNLEAMLRA